MINLFHLDFRDFDSPAHFQKTQDYSIKTLDN